MIGKKKIMVPIISVVFGVTTLEKSGAFTFNSSMKVFNPASLDKDWPMLLSFQDASEQSEQGWVDLSG